MDRESDTNSKPSEPAERCQNCGQAILPGDTACWQCGRPLSGAGDSPPLESAPDRTETEATMLVIYTIWTVVVILVAFLLLFLLTRQPIAFALP